MKKLIGLLLFLVFFSFITIFCLIIMKLYFEDDWGILVGFIGGISSMFMIISLDAFMELRKKGGEEEK